MSTRGLIGYRMDGETLAQYNHSDSYPAGLGLDVLDQARSIPPSALRSYIGNLPKNEWMDDEFFNNRLSCEWAYFINVDTGRFEVFCHGIFLRSYDLEALPSDTKFSSDMDLEKENKTQEIEYSWMSFAGDFLESGRRIRPGLGLEYLSR